MTSVIDVIHDKIQSTKVYKPRKGVIIAVRAQTALVRPVGSATTIPCAFDPQQGVEVDKVCTYIWVQGRKEYVIQSVFSPKSTILSPDQNKTAFELSPPSNLVHDDSLPGCVLLIWDCPPQQDITFEVMYNSSAAEAGAQTMRTRAGTAVIPTADDPTYFRIRSVTEDWKYSSWTDWGSESPGTGAPGGGDSDAIHDNVGGEINAITEKVSPVSGDLLILEDSESSYAKKKVQIGNLPGGSGTDDDAIHDNVAGEIDAITAKTSLASGDTFLIEDSAASFAKKSIIWSNIVTAIKNALFNTFFQVGVGLAKSFTSSFQISLDFPSLTEDTTPDGAADFLVTYDGSASTYKKVKPNNLPVPALDLDDLGDVNTSGVSDGDVLTYDSGDWIAQAPAGGTPITRYVATVLHDETLVSAGSFDVTSIPSGYQKLEIFLRIKSNNGSTTDTVYVTFNGDTTGSHYWRQNTLSQNGIAGGSANNDRDAFPYVGGTGYSDFTEVHAWMIDYDDSSAEKHMHYELNIQLNSTTLQQINGWIAWEDTDPVDQITFASYIDPTNQFIAGSSLLILGWKAETI